MNLEELLEEAVKNTDKRLDFINAMINSEIYAIGAKLTQTNDEGKEIPALNLFSVNNKENKRIVPFFTSVDKLNLFAAKVAPGNPPCMKMPCIEFFKLVAANNAGAVINLNSQYAKEFGNEEIKMLLTKLTSGIPVTNINTDENAIIALPKVYPEELIKDLKKFCRTRLDIKAAYVFDIIYPHSKPHLLIVVDFEFNRPELNEKINNIIKEHMNDENDIYDVMSAKEEMVKSFISRQKPFYSKTGA